MIKNFKHMNMNMFTSRYSIGLFNILFDKIVEAAIVNSLSITFLVCSLSALHGEVKNIS